MSKISQRSAPSLDRQRTVNIRVTLAVVAFVIAVNGALALAFWIATLRNAAPTLAHAGVVSTVAVFLGSLLRFSRVMLA